MNQKDESFKDFVLDQLRGLDDVEARRMFGGYGLYQDETFFGIIHKDRVYFKIDGSTVGEYRKRKMKPFRPNANQTLKSYYQVPLEILEDAERLGEWATQAISCQQKLAVRRGGKSHERFIDGGCQMRAARYKFSGEPLFCGNGHCRDCQRVSDGA